MRYLVILAIVTLLTWIASNLLHGRIGRSFMAVRDMDIAAELIGIKLYQTKLLAFAVSSYYCGVAGALMVFLWYGSAEPAVFGIDQSFLILFMVIIGGLGSLVGSFFGAALIYALPIACATVSARSACRSRRHGRAPHPHDGGGTDRPVPDHRAARARPAVADRKAETEGLAIPLLRGQTARQSSAETGPRHHGANTKGGD